MTRYAELAVTSNFSFLRGASHARDLVGQALALGHAGIGIADRNTVAGVVRAYSALSEAKAAFRKQHGAELAFKLAVGARLVFADGTPDILAYPENRAGWGRLCRLLTTGNRRAPKGECFIELGDLLERASDLLLIVMPERRPEGLTALLPSLREAAPGAVWLAATMHRRGDDRRRLIGLRSLAAEAGVPLIAVNDVLYHDVRPAPAAGRGHLHPRGGDHRDRGQAAGGQCRTAPEDAGRDGAALRRRAGGDRRDGAFSRSHRLLAR